MSSPINLSRFNALVNQYLSKRITADRLASLAPLTDQLFVTLISDLNHTIDLYNSFPACLAHSSCHADMFINTNHLKSIYNLPLPSYSSILNEILNKPKDLDITFSEMRDSTYFHHIYEIDKSEHLLANLMTLVYRCYLLASIPSLWDNKAQISSTLEEMATLRYLLGEDNLYFQSIRHWIKDWEGEGFSQQLSEIITPNSS